MPSIDPAPHAGNAPLAFSPAASPEGVPLQAARPEASPLPVPARAGGNHIADAGDYITFGLGVAGIGALGIAAAGTAGAAGAAEGFAVGAAALVKAVGTAAKAYGPRLAEHWRDGTEQLKDASSFGKFAADQTTAAASDFARTAAIGGGLSAGAALTQRVAHALAPAPQRAAAAAKAPECAVGP